MPEEEEKNPIEVHGDVSTDALEAVFVGDEIIVEEEEILIIETLSPEEEDDVDLAFQEDEGYW